jgi:two-component system cell cycle sensor histidine kinase/response regulator CckA
MSTASKHTILVVEDEDLLRARICRTLREEGYQVLDAPNGAAALELLNGPNPTHVDLVLTDLRMPVMDGRELAAVVARLRPALPIVFMSGYTAQLLDLRLVSPELIFLAKPFRSTELVGVVHRQLRG